MNNAQRKAIASITQEIESIDLDGLAQTLTDMQAEEQDKFDNLSEGLQASERGQAIEAAADNLQEALDALEEAKTSLEAAVEALNTASE